MAGPRKSHPTDGRSTVLTRSVGAVTNSLGSFPAILAAGCLVLSWASGLLVVKGGFLNQDYQLVINTVTTIITFLMVFVIQNTQNREGRAIQTKLDAQIEALAAMAKSMDVSDDCLPRLLGLVGVEDAPDEVIRTAQDQVRVGAS